MTPIRPGSFSVMRSIIVNLWICLCGHQIYQRCTSKWWSLMHRFSGSISQDLIVHISMRNPHIFIWTVKLVWEVAKHKELGILKYATNCDDLQWDGKRIAILMQNRVIGYQATNEYGLSTSDCLCYRFLPSISDILSNHKKSYRTLIILYPKERWWAFPLQMVQNYWTNRS